MPYVLSLIISLAFSLTYNAPGQASPVFGAVQPFTSAQLSAGADNGECLTTNGSANAWGACGGGGVTGGTAGMMASWVNSTTLTATSTPTASAFYATSTRASVLPYASSTAISATTASTTNAIVSSVRSALVLNGATGVLGAYGGSGACTNQFVTVLSAAGVGTCASVTDATFSGQLGISHGGTNQSAFTTSGNTVYYTGSALQTSPTNSAATTPFASSTAISTTYASSTFYFGAGLASCSGGNFLTFDGAGRFGCAADSVGGGGSYPFTPAITFSTTTSATTSSIWTKGVFFASSTVAASQFPYASTTALSSDFLFVNTTAKIGSLSGAVSASAGVLSAGTLSIANGGTNQTTYGTTGGMIYFDGTKLTQSAGGDPFYDAANIRFIVGRASGSFRINGVGTNGNGYLGIDSASGVTTGDVFLINTSGNVGIATTTPGAKLGVTGNMFIAGNITSTSTLSSFFPYASSTAISTGYASSTSYFGAGLADCNTGNMLTWTAGRFGCEDDSTGAGGGTYPFTPTTWAGIQISATSTGIWNKAFLGFIASSSIINYSSSTAITASAALYVDSTRIQNFETFAFSYGSSTQGSGTTTRYLAPAANPMTVDSVQCDFSHFMQISLYDGTNRADYVMASGTIGTYAYSSNNAFIAGEAIRVDVSTTTNTSANVAGGCRFKFRYTN